MAVSGGRPLTYWTYGSCGFRRVEEIASSKAFADAAGSGIEVCAESAASAPEGAFPSRRADGDPAVKRPAHAAPGHAAPAQASGDSAGKRPAHAAPGRAAPGQADGDPVGKRPAHAADAGEEALAEPADAGGEALAEPADAAAPAPGQTTDAGGPASGQAPGAGGASLAAFRECYRSRDGLITTFEDATGHFTSVDTSRLV